MPYRSQHRGVKLIPDNPEVLGHGVGVDVPRLQRGLASEMRPTPKRPLILGQQVRQGSALVGRFLTLPPLYTERRHKQEVRIIVEYVTLYVKYIKFQEKKTNL